MEVAAVIRQDYGVNARVAFRLAHGWSQREAADRWNERWPAEPKTFKNFSYWENWPSKTGYEPSLDVLGRLAELYECSVPDLLVDYADFRHSDPAHSSRKHVDNLPSVVNATTVESEGAIPPAGLDGLAERLDEMDVHELAELGSTWVQQLGSRVDRRTLLLRLSAALTLAAAMPAIASADMESASASLPPAMAGHRLAGIWHSRYVFYSSGREGDFEGEHYVVLRDQDGRLVGQSLPHSLDSQLRLELTVDGSIATGTWRERTSPTGYYKGASYHGTLQLLIDPRGRTMNGKWLGFDKGFKVNSGDWELSWVDDSVSHRSMRRYHLKA